MSWLKPRSIRGQLISGLILFEGLLVVVFAILLVREQALEIHERARLRLESEVNLLALQSQDSLAQGQAGYLVPILRAMINSPAIRTAMVTDTNGRVIASSDPEMNGKELLTRLEKKHLEDTTRAVIFRVPGGAREAVQAIHVGGQLSGFAWVYEDATAAWQQIYSLIRITFIFAGLGALGTAIIAGTLARSITRPLRALLAATRKLIRDPETKEGFPLEVTSNNESADLTRAFNLMVTSIEEQRAGLSDTLALLDSMLENAPIGFAFFDRKFRYVRVNQFLAEMNQVPIGRHLGRTIAEMLPGPAAETAAGLHVQSVFETGQPVAQFELNTPLPGDVDPGAQLAHQCVPGEGYVRGCSLGGSDCGRSNRAEARRGGFAENGKTGCRGASGGFHRPRNQQSAGGGHQSSVPAAAPAFARSGGDRLRRPGPAGNLPRRRDDAADPALLSPIDPARWSPTLRSCWSRFSPSTQGGWRRCRSRFLARSARMSIFTVFPGSCARSSPT